MDTLVLNAILQELQQQICPSRINTITQLEEYILILSLWNRQQECRLEISVDARFQYLFLTDEQPGNQAQVFGKFLQHHIKGGEIRKVSKPPFERVITFDIAKKDIDGSELHYQLILEIMGRHSNVILLQQQNQKILDSIRHVTAAQSSYRRIAPGALYVPPPIQKKRDPATITQEQFQHLLTDYNKAKEQSPNLQLWKYLIQHIQGLSPLLTKEIERGEPAQDDNAYWERFSTIVHAIMSAASVYQPTVFVERQTEGRDRPVALSALQLKQFTKDFRIHRLTFSSMSEASAHYYHTLVNHQQRETLRTSLLRALGQRLTKQKKKREHLAAQQEQIERAEEYKHKGELLTANIYQLQKGMKTASVLDYYQDEQPQIDIELDPRLTPSQNAQRYFKRYNKLKQGKKVTQQRLLETCRAITYLEEVKFFLETAETIEELQQFHTELHGAAQGSSQGKSRRKKQKHDEPVQPFLRLLSSDGFPIYVGRNSRENDLLTQRTAQPEDIWLHAHQAPGSHVLILNRDRRSDIPESTLREAAALAAYHSKLRKSGKADVIYTRKKYVKKPKGSPPGLVIVSQFQTIRVTPEKQ
ncbi:hypothetical protein CSA56_12565 [candidate division KSB3 bacterium]|uniref:Rqc2 homolog RqcH n=1 Tax=candidate division KSB3 bacterium TaxID=2044937 RepID=A0A2G6KBT0_9BACT|nr:MAG: hypothetical protein CSA56_12565 [candidate division KSB3 bacterium]